MKNFSEVVNTIQNHEHFESTVINAARTGFNFTQEQIQAMAQKAHELKLADGTVARIFGHLGSFESAAREKLAEISGHRFTNKDLVEAFSPAASQPKGVALVNLRDMSPTNPSSSNTGSEVPRANPSNGGEQVPQVPASSAGQNNPPPPPSPSRGLSAGEICGIGTVLAVVTSIVGKVVYTYKQIPGEERAKMTYGQLSLRVVRDISNEANGLRKKAQEGICNGAEWTKKTVWPKRTA
jgi:hypothetical protein